jgi:phage portal protein BeeE
MKANLLERDNQKSQLMEARAFQLLEVCRLLRLSPHKLADMGRATWGNVEQLNINHYNETLRPWCERWEQSIKLRCLREERGVYVKHNIGGFLRGDFRTQTEGFAKLIMTGVHSVNEVRALLDLNPIPDGDKHYIPVNLADVAATATALNAIGGGNDVPKSLAEIEAQLLAQPDLMAALSGRNGIGHS